MSLDRCIPNLVETGKLTPEQGKKARAVYGDYVSQYEKTMGRAAAEALASRDTVDSLAREAKLQKRQALLQVKAQQTMLVDMASFDHGSNKHPGMAALALLAHDDRARFMSVEAQREAITGRAHAIMTDLLFKHGRDILSRVRDKAGLNDLIREAHGEDTGNRSAREFARAWAEAADMLRERFNAAGGAIDKLKDWGLPHAHDAMKVRAAGADDPRMADLQARYKEASGIERPAIAREMTDVTFQNWRDAILPRLDPSRMIDGATGRPFADKALGAALRDVFDTIRSEGLNDLNPGGQSGMGKLANRRADSRFLVFKSADDWMAYADRFASRDAFDVMMGHVGGMARDIALMERLGPNPAASIRWLQDGLRKGAALDPDPGATGVVKADVAGYELGKMYQVLTGSLSAPVRPKVAYFLGSLRSLIGAAKLGSAPITATTDLGFQAVTRAYNGLPLTSMIGDYLKLLNPADRATKQWAVRMGLIADQASKMAAGQSRYLGEVLADQFSQRLSEFVLRASGLSAWTQAGHWSLGMAILGHMADQLADTGAHAFDKLEPAFKGMLDRYGVDAKDWDTLRATPLYEPKKGVTFLDPTAIADPVLGDKILRMLHTEKSYTVPHPTLRTRAMMTFDRPGTVAGELSRNFGMFKSFGVSVILNHGARAMEAEGGWNKAKYAAGLIATTTIMGAFALAMKALVKGEDPRIPVEGDAKEQAAFWSEAALQGGGFGIMGDYLEHLTSDRSSGNGSLGDTIAGPIAGTAVDYGGLIGGSVAKAVQGKDPHMGAQAIRLLRSYTPGSTLWYGRLAMDRLVFDQLQQQIDPHYADSWNRMHQRARQTGQDYWFSPGDTLPARAPQIATGATVH